MASPLSPNRIHSLPVQVNYHLPSSCQTFTTLFTTPQQVYVHPSASGSSQEDESWGSIYLKTVVEGVVWASPELHPSHPHTPDLSLYILDPRETSLRSSRSSSLGSSPSVGTSQEVWTGKGLMSWALNEPGVGKNLITGRLVRSRDFAGVAKNGMSAMEALMSCRDEEIWGIEISIGLKDGLGPPVQVKQIVQAKREIVPPPKRPLSPTRINPVKRSAEKPKPPMKKRKTERNRLSSIDPNVPSSSRSDDLSVLPGELYTKPDSLTKDQAQRLLASPAFLNMIQKLTKPEVLKVKDEKEEGPVCYNCGRTKSAVWRTKEMEDGQPRRLCNACGLYWNKLKVMRPPTMWEGVDEDIPRKGGKSTPAPSSEADRPAPRIDTPTGFKRTLSLVAEKESKRIASLRNRPHVKSNLKPAMTSPPRGSASASRPMRTIGVSSPGWNNTVATSSKTVHQSLDLPLSDDTPKVGEVDWTTDLSAFFDVEGFSMPTDMQSEQNQHQPVTSSTLHSDPFARNDPSDQDDVMSQLFHRTSSVNQISSSPPFDFSQLPPSSPPMMPTSEILPHSALLLSSPDCSPAFSPFESEKARSRRPSQLPIVPNASVTVAGGKEIHVYGHEDIQALLDQFNQSAGIDGNGNSSNHSVEALQEMLRMAGDHGDLSSAAAAEGLCGNEDDIFALLNESFAEVAYNS